MYGPPDVAGGVYVHDWLVTGLPPVHPDGEDAVTERVCVLFD